MNDGRYVYETKRQGRIAHHHTDATVPHIVALLGSTFHAAKIGTFFETSKYFAEILARDDRGQSLGSYQGMTGDSPLAAYRIDCIGDTDSTGRYELRRSVRKKQKPSTKFGGFDF